MKRVGIARVHWDGTSSSMTSDPKSLAGLLSLDGDSFVEAAYQTVLGRSPDREGHAYYFARLRIGYSKFSILHQLWTSGEARSQLGVPGLARAMRRYRMGRLLLIGWVMRKLWQIEGESVRERLQRAMISELAAMRFELTTRAWTPPASADQDRRELTSPSARTDGRRNLVAEKLSPRAREIFDRIVSG